MKSWSFLSTGEGVCCSFLFLLFLSLFVVDFKIYVDFFWRPALSRWVRSLRRRRRTSTRGRREAPMMAMGPTRMRFSFAFDRFGWYGWFDDGKDAEQSYSVLLSGSNSRVNHTAGEPHDKRQAGKTNYFEKISWILRTFKWLSQGMKKGRRRNWNKQSKLFWLFSVICQSSHLSLHLQTSCKNISESFHQHF